MLQDGQHSGAGDIVKGGDASNRLAYVLPALRGLLVCEREGLHMDPWRLQHIMDGVSVQVHQLVVRRHLRGKKPSQHCRLAVHQSCQKAHPCMAQMRATVSMITLCPYP